MSNVQAAPRRDGNAFIRCLLGWAATAVMPSRPSRSS
jgi:hypothetical protein